MTALLTADLHVTDRPQDEYRWGLFPWLKQQIAKYKVNELILLGDVTEAKDRHSAKLVNRLCGYLYDLSDKTHIIWLMGNHDRITAESPFFGFIDNNYNMTYVSEPKILELSIGKGTFIPAGLKWNFKLHDYPYVFTHATFTGSKAENGTLLTGVNPALLKGYEGECYSGDIHVPQKIGKNIEYVGAPYHIKFGDEFNPRIILKNNDGTADDLMYPAPRKHVLYINEPDDLLEFSGTITGDFVKIKCSLRRTDYTHWRERREAIREIAGKNKWVLCGIEMKPIDAQPAKEKAVDNSSIIKPADLVNRYAKEHKVGKDYLDIGSGLLM